VKELSEGKNISRKDAKRAKKTRQLWLHAFAPSRLCVRMFIFSHVLLPVMYMGRMAMPLLWLRLRRAAVYT
jgi:hypothetical protein